MNNGTQYPARTFTGRERLSFFIDAAVEMLDPPDLKMTLMTRYCLDGLDKGLVDRVLWELEDHAPHEVAAILNVPEETVWGLARLSGELAYR